MKLYYIIFYLLKITFLTLCGLLYLGVIPSSSELYKLTENILSIFIALFIIYFFTFKADESPGFHDRLIILMGGYVLLVSAFRTS